jgi:hypothetical protein
MSKDYSTVLLSKEILLFFRIIFVETALFVLLKLAKISPFCASVIVVVILMFEVVIFIGLFCSPLALIVVLSFSARTCSFSGF